MRRKKKEKGRAPDRVLLILTLLLVGIGLIMVADASAPQALKYFSDELFFFKQQVVWAILGVILFLFFSFVKYSFWEKIATPFFVVSLILLLLVLFPGIGLTIYGARRWISFGPISFQPSELVKLSMILYIAKVAKNNKKPVSYFLPVSLVSFLIMLEPDLGTTVVIASIAMIQIFASGMSFLFFLAGGAVAAIFGAVLILTSDYRRDRLLTFLSATADPLGKDYHVRQLLLALGSGGIFGVGLGHSRLKHLFLPEAATDSIVAVLAEELGLVGSSILVVMFTLLVLKGIRISMNSQDKFARIVAVGIVAWISIQVFLNIGSAVALVPLTGVPLPFISYGGTALTTLLISAGILLNISRYVEK